MALQGPIPVEARGADKAITDAIDTHVEDEQRKDADEDDATGAAG